MRGASPLLLLPLFGPAMFGCASTVQVITIERNVFQEAVVPPPEGAVAAGPLAEAGGISVEGGISGVAAGPASQSRRDGALGHLTSLGAGHLRLAGRVDDAAELGLGLELFPGPLNSAAATDLEDGGGDVGFLMRGGPQLRVAAPLGNGFAWKVDGDLRLTPISVRREIDVTELEQYATDDGWAFSESGETDQERWTKWPLLARAGTGLGWTGDNLHLAAGAVYQQAVVVPGYDQARWSCYHSADEVNDQCEGPPMPPVIERIWVPTATATVGLKVGRSWLLAQGWAHLGEDSEGVVESAPAGAMISMRLPLFKERAPPVLQPQDVADWHQVSPPATAAGWHQVSAAPVPPGWKMVRPPTVGSPPPAVDEPVLAIPAGQPPPPPAEQADELPPAGTHAPPPE